MDIASVILIIVFAVGITLIIAGSKAGKKEALKEWDKITKSK